MRDEAARKLLAVTPTSRLMSGTIEGSWLSGVEGGMVLLANGVPQNAFQDGPQD